MGLYDRYVLPRLTSWVCASGSHGRYRQQVVPRARGRVVELGAGSGHNLPLYDAKNVELVWAVEPSAGMWQLAAPRLTSTSLRVEHLAASAESVPLESGVADTVVVTWSLCTIPHPELALGEARRLLKPGGRLLFAEHGEAPDEDVRRWQHRLDPVWSRFSGGCHINRDVPGLLAGGGFLIDELHAGYLPGARPFSFNLRGVARAR